MEMGNQLWYEIGEADRMPAFLMTMASDSDHWLFISSNGGMTAGRVNPDKALFPYYTQDKLEAMAESSGSCTILRIVGGGGGVAERWEPFTRLSQRHPEVARTIRKNLYGNHIQLEESHSGAGLKWQVSWRPSGRFGLVRGARIENTGVAAVRIQLLDGIQNILPPGFNQRFINEFSNLGNAYKQSELDPADGLALYHLSSVPTDLAEPKEALLANAVWQVGLEGSHYLLSDVQVNRFLHTGAVEQEEYMRARPGAYLMVREIELPAGASMSWHICADIEQDARKVEDLKQLLGSGRDLAALVEQDCEATERRLSQMLAKADGLQLTDDRCKVMRHTSNTLFNLMRGGTFLNGYDFPMEDLKMNLRHFNKAAARKAEKLLEGQESLGCIDLWENPGKWCEDPDVARLMREYLPLSFSRRHGDPSRPWNRFSIEIRNPDGSPRYSYQGNWRDIFQNWEALVHAYPEYCEAAIFRFLNATTADGYNPYRLTKDGYDWEVIDPHDSWANIGYWGDHQIIYLLKLLETSVHFHPDRLVSMLSEDSFVYAEVPYRIRSYEEILKDPRATVDYDSEWEKRIAAREREMGADGKLSFTAEGDLVRVSLMEKLLSPLMTKMSNLIPGGGIWMNTQRPEWNDANNALVGYGVSVVTLAYIHRYLEFLTNLFGESIDSQSFALSLELAELLRCQSAVFGRDARRLDPAARKSFMDDLGIPASGFRLAFYENGLSGRKAEVTGKAIQQYLKACLNHVRVSLGENKRQDALWHSYNLVSYTATGANIHHLKVMLEGQVAILSSGILDTGAAISLLEGLRASPLYREDQNSYILYPDSDLPRFLKKNRIGREAVESIPGLSDLIGQGDESILVALPSGDFAFNGSFHNANDLGSALAKSSLSEPARTDVLDLFEKVFHHHAFTGRSGTFFAYEGLGSIYWHMVSKLALAVQETYLHSRQKGDPGQQERILDFYREIFEGLGVHKDPRVYGAFPTDAYSHTPAHAGAQQPGMTGQVKEDILLRLNELGVRLRDGCVAFVPDMLEPHEFLQEKSLYRIPANGSGETLIEVDPGCLAFSFCGVPVIYRTGTAKQSLAVFWKDAEAEEFDTLKLSRRTSKELFHRNGRIERIEVNLGQH